MVLAIGGTIAANLLTGSDIEIVVKKGPFGSKFAEAGMLDHALGNGQRFSHLKDPQVAYQQLLGISENRKYSYNGWPNGEKKHP
ncbi:hypothetical protein EJA70_17785 [Pseudomonas sp. PB103]|uniref:hypothetical protein n=1 Tax=Pseudomonas sp. PB103 TaxID=2494698 RepID=UPI00131B4076|nr:hypothetical protein [Pseudomonas sp. PB103]KAE9642814.1 hypothetical protein EJA70_17785 [Pseudomonas sp. PB103]